LLTNSTCELYDNIEFQDGGCDKRGNVYVLLTGEPFPKSAFTSFGGPVAVEVGTSVLANLTNGLYSPSACHRYCDSSFGCIATIFDDVKLKCIIFTQDQLMEGLKKGFNSSVANISYVIEKTQYKVAGQNKSIGCPVLQSFLDLEASSNQLSFAITEASCATICVNSKRCNFFHRNFITKTCHFFLRQESDGCGQSAIVTIIDTNSTEIIELDNAITLSSRPYYKEVNKIAVRSEFVTYALGLENKGKQNLETCQRLCDVFLECVAAGVVYFENVASCKLFQAFLVLDDDVPSAESAVFFVALESIQNSDNFLTAPNGTCPFSQLNNDNGGSKGLCERDCILDKACGAYIWDNQTTTCSLIQSTYFKYCPYPPKGVFSVDYHDFVYLYGGYSPFGSVPSPAVEVAPDIPSLVYCEALCAAHKSCHALWYNSTSQDCSLLTSCGSAEYLGLTLVCATFFEVGISTVCYHCCT
jgi:hypothetical protein